MANPVLESLNEAPIIQRVIIMIAIVVIPLYLFANYSYLPNKTKLNQLENEVAKLQNISNRLTLVKRDLKRQKEQFKVLSEALPDKKEIPNLINGIVSLAHKNNITVNSFNPSLVVEKNKFYNTVNINLDLVTDYKSLGKFITDLSEAKRIIVPGKILIRGANTKPDGIVKAHVSLQLSTYYFKRTKKR